MGEQKFGNYSTALKTGFEAGDTESDRKTEEAANLKLIQKMAGAIGCDDFDAAGDLLAEDVVLDIRCSHEFPFVRNARGRAEVIDAVRHNFGALRDQRPAIEAVVAQGDTVVILSREDGKFAASGERYTVHCMHRYAFRDGKFALIHELLVPGDQSPD